MYLVTYYLCRLDKQLVVLEHGIINQMSRKQSLCKYLTIGKLEHELGLPRTETVDLET
jgi:hypothetical protein